MLEKNDGQVAKFLTDRSDNRDIEENMVALRVVTVGTERSTV